MYYKYTPVSLDLTPYRENARYGFKILRIIEEKNCDAGLAVWPT